MTEQEYESQHKIKEKDSSWPHGVGTGEGEELSLVWLVGCSTPAPHTAPCKSPAPPRAVVLPGPYTPPPPAAPPEGGWPRWPWSEGHSAAQRGQRRVRDPTEALRLSSTPKPPAMIIWGLLSLLLLTVARGTSIGDQDEDIQVQENFEAERMHGKWFDIAIGTTCRWMKNYKEKFSMGTLVLGPGPSTDQISTTSTRLRQGDCTLVSGEYQKTSIPGKYTYYNPRWDVSIQSYVLRTNYDEYAVILMKKKSSFGPSTTLKLYGRSPELREDLIESFHQLALEMGIPEDSIFILANRGECVPQETGNAPQRARRAVLPLEEGSAAGPLPTYIGNKEDSCRLSRDPGPCSGMLSRFFYNSSSMACETFHYGGCLGNGNNFYSEKECLQACRTEAACRLPIVPGPCQAQMTRWAFDAAQGKCITFSYGGCKGNGNQFYSEKECKEYCGAPQLAEDEEFLQLSN